MARLTASAARPTPSRAAGRAASSRILLVTGATIAFGDCCFASSARTGVHTSPRYGAKAAFSSTHTLVAPHAPSCLTPSSDALSVSHTASTLPPESRPASPSTSAMTFFGEPLRSSSTMHQNASAMSDRLRFLAQRADELLDGVLDLARDHAPRWARRQRLQSLHRQLWRSGGDPEVGRLHVLDLLLLGAPDPFQRWIARLFEALLRRHDGRQRQLEDLQAAFHLTADTDRLAVAIDRLLHDPRRRRPAEELGDLRGHRAHVVVDRLAAADHEPRLLLLDDGRQRLGRQQRVGVGQRGIVHMVRAIAAYRERGA